MSQPPSPRQRDFYLIPPSLPLSITGSICFSRNGERGCRGYILSPSLCLFASRGRITCQSVHRYFPRSARLSPRHPFPSPRVGVCGGGNGSPQKSRSHRQCGAEGGHRRRAGPCGGRAAAGRSAVARRGAGRAVGRAGIGAAAPPLAGGRGRPDGRGGSGQ